MSKQQRREARRRFNNWQKLPQERRALIRERAEMFRDLSPEEQKRVRENFRRYE